MYFSTLKKWIPFSKLLPLKTFLKRSLRKWNYTYGFLFGLSGADEIGQSENGNVKLKLRKNYFVGSKGDIIEIPKDRVIYEEILRLGEWELEESAFLANGLKLACKESGENVALLDIGANTGLITLQTMNSANTHNHIFVFEPIKRHFNALRSNLDSLSRKVPLHFINAALSDRNGEAEIYSNSSNFGNSSLIESVIPNGQVESVKLIDAEEFWEKHLNYFERFVLKSDTEGLDALILSRFPNLFWSKVERAIIEIWAIPSIQKKHVDFILNQLSLFQFTSFSIDRTKSVDSEEIRKFWLGKSGKHLNLFLSR